LMEIVTQPEISSGEEAFAFLTSLKQILVYGDVSDADMEKGQLRCDCNISVRSESRAHLGAKIEIKNLNSISGVRRALQHEIQRQIRVLEGGGELQQETRGWDVSRGETFPMRTKESAHDYRYFPDPDLVPFKTEALLPEARQRLPELPAQKRLRFVKQYDVTNYDAAVLANDLELANYFEIAAQHVSHGKAVANWILNDLQSALTSSATRVGDSRIEPQNLAELVQLVQVGKISGKQAKEVFAEMFASGRNAGEIIEEKNIEQVSDSRTLEALADQVITENPKPVADFKAGHRQSLNFLKGQLMKLSKGKANPQFGGQILEEKLNAS
jgi:aspartyl-tRNA(Asn)/glutamyl-tRNA(Gln) amidotransferase subunit B